MLRIVTLMIVCLLSVAATCIAQDTKVADQSVDSGTAAGLPEGSDTDREPSSAIASVSDFLVLTFILLMFTNAVICGHWAINTGRNFWAWYVFGLFTGPLAGSCMLHRTAIEKFGAKNPVGPLGTIAGIGIPLAGWLIWVLLLK